MKHHNRVSSINYLRPSPNKQTFKSPSLSTSINLVRTLQLITTARALRLRNKIQRQRSSHSLISCSNCHQRNQNRAPSSNYLRWMQGKVLFRRCRPLVEARAPFSKFKSWTTNRANCSSYLQSTKRMLNKTSLWMKTTTAMKTSKGLRKTNKWQM